MKFGLILLVLILALSLVGTLIPQGEEVSVYQERYGAFAETLKTLQLDHIYTAWYFALLFGLLCLNLLLCSVLRGLGLKNAAGNLALRAETSKAEYPIRGKWLKGFHQTKEGVYTRHTVGLWGSFITHLGLLLLLISAGLVLSLQTKVDATLSPGETYTLSNGTVIEAQSFTLKNEAGETDYRTQLRATAPDGTVTEPVVAVNQPVTFGTDKLFQSSYNYTNPSVNVQVQMDDAPEALELDGEVFLSLDGTNGITYHGIYTNVAEDENGQVSPVTGSDEFNPGFLVTTRIDGVEATGIVYPDVTLECGGFFCTFRAPAAYPVLCVRSLPGWALPFLYVSFALLLAGLYLCFFVTPMAVSVRGDKMYVAGKPGADLSMLMEDTDWEEE